MEIAMDFPAPATLFRLANSLALLGWIALAVSPGHARWAGPARRFAGRWLPLAFAVVYVALVAAYWPADGGFSSLEAVQRLFAVPGLLTAGWLHYLAFDLFVGSYVAQRAADLRFPHALVLVLLVLCFLFGPAGWLAYAALRASVYRGDAAVTPAAAAG
jgi:hypothetical protein